jgi:hypothetical protein
MLIRFQMLIDVCGSDRAVRYGGGLNQARLNGLMDLRKRHVRPALLEVEIRFNVL